MYLFGTFIIGFLVESILLFFCNKSMTKTFYFSIITIYALSLWPQIDFFKLYISDFQLKHVSL